MIFYSLQGLGNSIINFPILSRLRASYAVTVVCFNNGSSKFFKTFHDHVIGVNSRAELVQVARRMKSEASFTCFPTWRRELAASFFCHADKKFILRPHDNPWARGLWRFQETAEPGIHHLENNFNLLKHALPEERFTHPVLKLNVANLGNLRVLGIHPTASSPSKYYPLVFWQELIGAVAKDYDRIELYCGTSPTEIEYCEKIKGTSSLTVHVGLDFATLASHISSTSLFIGSDSALLHLAAMMGKRSVGLWSFANFRVIYPYGGHVQVLLPTETLAAKSFEYPSQAPPYLLRASAAHAVQVINNQVQPSFTISPRYTDPIQFYAY